MARKEILTFRRGSAALLFACGLTPLNALAQDREEQSPLTRARALFAEARSLVEEGRLGEACGLFEQSLRLEAGIGTKVHLGDCWERIGRTASAQLAFHGAAAEAELAGQTERADVAKQRARALEGRIPKLRVEVEERVPGLSVRVDRVILEEAEWGAPRPMDPGAYQVEARAPGRASFSKRVDLPPAGSLIIIAVPPLVDAAEIEPTKPASEEAEPASPRRKRASVAAAEPERTRAAPEAPLLNPLSIGLGVAGLGGLVLGTYYGLEFRSRDAEARTICADGGVCTRADIDRHDKLVQESASRRTGAYLGFGIGAAALTGAAILLITGRSNQEAPRVGAAVLPDGSWSFQANGAF